MYSFTLLATPLVALLAASQAAADLTFTSPSQSQYAIQNSSLKVTWTYSDPVPARISLKLYNVNNVPFQGKLAIGIVSPSDKNFTYNKLSDSWTGDGWVILAEDANSTANATAYGSQSFSIKPIGTDPPAVDSTSSNGDSKSSSASSSFPITHSILALASGSLLASMALVF
ncbi:hypothetical protein BJ684DRAFT_19625 [Piptocephalis cylindrospora]|uniref:Ser-Thr-rich glycosyl-phosphatidyl-inositol-anchored membrane family-domain-containing protein n=1 Tax=Piptocephalis cylindrospora TaxID=1907219 RepID=A0A4P9Y7M9_9FUNG|nr:hypothetical protein BJ684DRAFT_19625 [Piptocephalis cylindrospora]|eukprot:RKP13930.1 hypothetical protein BJ684DRAFT_19625 [Piptocephalis cylindrospora]